MPNDDFRTLRFRLSGEWTVADAAVFFSDMNALYAIGLGLESPTFREVFGWNFPWGWPRTDFVGPPDFPALQVRRIQYGSDGIADLAGIGTAVGHIKDFVLRLIELRASRERRQQEGQLRELDIQAKRIENARKFVELGIDLGLTPEQIRILLLRTDEIQGDVLGLLDGGKLTGVRELPRRGRGTSRH